MRLGALVLQEQQWRTARMTWTRLEELGFDAAYAADHLTHRHVAGRWWADGWTTLAAAAGVTERMRLGTLVASAAVRSPTSLARMAATLQDISGGRFVLGIGAGLPEDARADRGEWVGNARLFARYDETVSAVRALWLGSSTWVGRHVRFEGVEPAPHAPHMLPPPIVLSAGGPRGFDLAARQGDGWVTFGGPRTMGLADDDWWAAIAGQSAEVTAACERIERDPARIDRRVLVGWSGPQPWSARDALADILGRAEELGFHEVVVYAPVGEPGDRFWADPGVVADAVSGVRAPS
jgi:alkanesulfonate monooxygenase SsuD/methylene tetrahydromethanopterin reductase-like flavin-dependent oxidoreductase (luciferase family)